MAPTLAPALAPGDAAAPCANYYEVLGVPPEADDVEIRRSYHSIVRLVHPDRQRPGGVSGSGLERLHEVQAAWRCLSDPTRRLVYDLRIFGGRSAKGGGVGGEGGGDELSRKKAKLMELQHEQALRDLGNMEVMLECVVRREQASKGVLIRKALYGDLRLREESLDEAMMGRRSIEEKDLAGPFINVTVPVQSFVERHVIILPGGASASKADLPGFYNPLPLDDDVELSLYVLYEFKGLLHEVITGDRETLKLPCRKHAVPGGAQPRGPFTSANVMVLRKPCPAGGGADAASVSHALSRKSARRGLALAESKLESAVRDYRLWGLRRRTAGDGGATPREFLGVALTAGLAWAVATWWGPHVRLARLLCC